MAKGTHFATTNEAVIATYFDLTDDVDTWIKGINKYCKAYNAHEPDTEFVNNRGILHGLHYIGAPPTGWIRNTRGSWNPPQAATIERERFNSHTFVFRSIQTLHNIATQHLPHNGKLRYANAGPIFMYRGVLCVTYNGLETELPEEGGWYAITPEVFRALYASYRQRTR